MPPIACPACACRDARGASAHAVVAALREDDLDRAMDLGLLETEPCPACDASCAAALTDARDARRRALEARERYRARGARLQRRAEELRAKRAATPAVDIGTKAPALPAAAAAALARAKAKAAGSEPK
ncbi:hypothetical protein [Luteimonas gilva]|uniref:hypothetical protein n=1 Tax=Luteimonas gilva TaxID=2572684 RepID=UPI001CB99240|nr:hypothetical protein [Luteimonas gilva]